MNAVPTVVSTTLASARCSTTQSRVVEQAGASDRLVEQAGAPDRLVEQAGASDRLVEQAGASDRLVEQAGARNERRASSRPPAVVSTTLASARCSTTRKQEVSR